MLTGITKTRGAAPAAIGLVPGRWIAILTLFSVIAFLLLLHAAGLRFDMTSRVDRAILLGGAAAAIVRFQLRKPRSAGEAVMRDLVENAAVFIVFCLVGAMASYPVAALSHGFADAGIDRLDHALHLDWMSWYLAVARYPLLQWLGTFAYESIFVTPALILGYCAVTGRLAQARLFIASFWLAATATLVLFYFMPARGPLAFLDHGAIPYMPASALFQAETIPLLRAHLITSVSANALHGLVCMPSFHTTSAVLYIIAAWSIRPLLWPLITLNAAMLLSTPVEGTHYFVDMFAGAAVAVAAAVVTRAITRRLPVAVQPVMPAVPSWRGARRQLRRATARHGSGPDHANEFDRYRDDLRRMSDRQLVDAFSAERSRGPRASAMTDEIDRRNLSG